MNIVNICPNATRIVCAGGLQSKTGTKTRTAREKICARKCTILARSDDFNLIENIFHIVKRKLRM